MLAIDWISYRTEEAAMKMFEDLKDIASSRGQSVGQMIEHVVAIALLNATTIGAPNNMSDENSTQYAQQRTLSELLGLFW